QPATDGPPSAGSDATTSAAAPHGTLTVGEGETGFTWSAADGGPEDASAAVIRTEGGAVDLRMAPGAEPPTEQPRPVVLREVSAFAVTADGALAGEVLGQPRVSIDASTDATGGPSPVRRLADLGTAAGSSPAFDLDHTIGTRWE